MRTLATFTLIALAALPLAAQEEPAPAPKPVEEHRVIPIQTDYLVEILMILRQGELKCHASRELGLISMTGTKERLDEAEKLIRRLEAAAAAAKQNQREPVSSDLDLSIYFIGVGVEGVGREISAGSRLRAVVEQLRRNFPYEHYRLVVSDMVRAAVWDDDVRVAGVMPNITLDPEGKTPPYKSSYQLQFEFRGFAERQGVNVAIVRGLEAEWHIAVPAQNAFGFEMTQAALSSAVDLPEGKLVVLGKAGLPGQGTGIFLVLEARPVE